MSADGANKEANQGGLRRSAIKLALAGGVEYGLQLAMPVILVRCLEPDAFAQYRMLWLLASTMLALAPAFMPQSLFYFLPRASGKEGRANVIGNIMLYLAAAALVVGLVLNQYNPLLPATVHGLMSHSQNWSTLFLMLWVVASVFDVLPTAEMRAGWQANATMGMAIVRTVLLALAAWQTHNILWVVLALVVLALLKLGLLAWYLLRFGTKPRLGMDRTLLRQQLAYALPFAIGNALFLMRLQADQWVVASLMAPALYASFSIATVLQPVATLLRQPVYNAMMPRLNRAYAAADLAQIRHLITHSNAATAMLLIPVAGVFFLTAPELVQIVYTKRYMATAPVMQVYLVGMMINGFAIGHVLPALDLGRFSTLNNGVCLLLSVGLSLIGVHYFGLPGAALGSVATLAFSEFWSALVVAKKLETNVAHLLSWRNLWPTLLATGVALGSGLWLARVATVQPAWPVWGILLAKGMLFVALWLLVFLGSGGWAQVQRLRHFD
jgi:O-antigen/teichoic acid export membrane protein